MRDNQGVGRSYISQFVGLVVTLIGFQMPRQGQLGRLGNAFTIAQETFMAMTASLTRFQSSEMKGRKTVQEIRNREAPYSSTRWSVN